MSRPQNPAYAVISYAPNTNYPAGSNAWNGTPKRVTPAGANATELTPGATLPSQYLNYLLGGGFDVDSAAKTLLNSLVNMAGQLPALNWNPKVTPGSALIRGAFSNPDQAWWAVGSTATDILYRSEDGRTWVVQGGLGSALTCNDIAFDLNGNGVICCTGTTNIYTGAWASFESITWTQRAGVLSGTVSDTRVIYEPVNTLWAIVQRNAALGFKVYTSSNLTSWTAQTLPAGWTGYTGSNNAEINQGNGIFLAAYLDSGGPTLHILKSSNGTTWTDSTVAVSNAPTASSRPVYSPTDGAWYIVVGQGTSFGTRKSQVFRSTDGVTWTNPSTLGTADDVSLQDLDCIGSLLIGINDDGRILASYDGGGALWYWCGRPWGSSTASTKKWLRAGGGGVTCWDPADVLAISSSRFGISSQRA